MSQLTSAVTNIALVMVSVAATPCSLIMWAKVEFSGPAAQMELPETVPASSRKSITAHSDSGSQYGSGAYRQLQAKAGMRQSMSVRANPYHNAWTESLMGTLKTEMRQDGRFIEGSHARTDAFEYIEAYYNTRRKHFALGYQTPAQFEVQIHSLNQTTIVVQRSVASHSPVQSVAISPARPDRQPR